VNDLGVAAYILMHGYVVIGKKGRSIFFEVPEEDLINFDSLILEYQPPNDFYTFDSCLMFLKKISELPPRDNLDEDRVKVISDLGIAAYILMHEYKPKPLGTKVVGKRGKFVYFFVPEEHDSAFERLEFQYLPSQFQKYDGNLMALKGIL
jgi:hypothetical protein